MFEIPFKIKKVTKTNPITESSETLYYVYRFVERHWFLKSLGFKDYWTPVTNTDYSGIRVRLSFKEIEKAYEFIGQHFMRIEVSEDFILTAKEVSDG